MAEYNPSKIIKDGNTYNFRDTTKIPLAGSNQISGSLIPSTDGTVNLGGSSYQWNNVYATNFNGNVVGREELTLQSNSGAARILLRNNNASNFPNSVNIYSKVNDVEYGVFLNGGALFPTISGGMNFGYAQRRWKSVHTNAINDINPGALSLPSNSYVNVDTTNWDLTCQNGLMGSFTPTADGWLMLHVANSGTSEVNFWIISGVIRINSKSTLSTSDNNSFNMITIPVEKDKTYNIYGNASEYVAGRSISYCRFMPCQGNV